MLARLGDFLCQDGFCVSATPPWPKACERARRAWQGLPAMNDAGLCAMTSLNSKKEAFDTKVMVVLC